MVDDWIQIPLELVREKSHPRLVVNDDRPLLDAYLASKGASIFEVGVADSTSVSNVIQELRGVLPLPDWCGNGWDSIHDAIEEIRESWAFPVALIVRDFDQLLDRRTHLALDCILGFEEFESALSSLSSQLIVCYSGDMWPMA